MIEINGMRLCKHCFNDITVQNGICRSCQQISNRDMFPSALTEGEVLAGKYIVGRVLGKGGFGITYLCYDIKNNRKVAVKEYLPDMYSHRDTGRKTVSVVRSEDEKLYKTGEEKFYDEAKLLAQFRGNNGIVDVIEFFKENNTAYFVMEYLRGSDLKSYLRRRGALSENVVLRIAISVLTSLRSLHNKNILHRDISPDNIFICKDGQIKLIDFGASRIALSGKSNSLSVILKPGFAPLEQYQSNGNQGAWTDIYALGATMYYCLKLKPINDVISRLNDDRIDMSGISTELASVLRKMLCIQIKGRFKNADELIQVLHNIRISIMTNEHGSETDGGNGGSGETQSGHVKDSGHVEIKGGNETDSGTAKERKKDNSGSLLIKIMIGVCCACVIAVIIAILISINYNPKGTVENHKSSVPISVDVIPVDR
ncbi:MAG: serine/threonine protein kinase [Oscillospiraceae bacterium]|nr:serine/threonine protein kinase [Oscillospiraceae bacterium]